MRTDATAPADPESACDRGRGRGISRVRQRVAPRETPARRRSAPHATGSCPARLPPSYPAARSTTGRETPRAQPLPPAWRRLHLELTSRELTADGALPFANPCLTLCRHFGWRELQRGCGFGQFFKTGRQRDVCHRIHPVAGWDRILESRRNHKLEEFLRQLRLLAGSGAGGDFHLQIVTFAKVRGGVVIFFLFENVISRRGGVTQYQIAFTF